MRHMQGSQGPSSTRKISALPEGCVRDGRSGKAVLEGQDLRVAPEPVCPDARQRGRALVHGQARPVSVRRGQDIGRDEMFSSL